MEGFKRNVALSELPLKRTLSRPLRGEWAAEELGWGQADQLELLICPGERNVASVSGAEMVFPMEGNVLCATRNTPAPELWGLDSSAAGSDLCKVRNEDSGWKTHRPA